MLTSNYFKTPLIHYFNHDPDVFLPHIICWYKICLIVHLSVLIILVYNAAAHNSSQNSLMLAINEGEKENITVVVFVLLLQHYKVRSSQQIFWLALGLHQSFIEIITFNLFNPNNFKNDIWKATLKFFMFSWDKDGWVASAIHFFHNYYYTVIIGFCPNYLLIDWARK